VVPKEIERDPVRVEKSDEVEEIGGSGALLADGDEVEPPGRCDRLLIIVAGLTKAIAEQIDALVAEALEVLLKSTARLFDEGTRLYKGEREVAEGLRDVIGVAIVGAAATLHKQADRRVALQRLNLDRRRDAAPGLGPGGDQNVAGTGHREKVADRGGIVGVVDDKQPTMVVAQPGKDLRGRAVEVVGLREHTQSTAQVDEVGLEVGSADPPAHVVVEGVAVGVFQRKARLTDAPETGDRLHERGGALLRE
jgi:hypothetical protein